MELQFKKNSLAAILSISVLPLNYNKTDTDIFASEDFY